MARVKLFDGTILEFPDGTSDEIINLTILRETGKRRFGEKIFDAKELGNTIPGAFKAAPLGITSDFTDIRSFEQKISDALGTEVDKDTAKKLDDLRFILNQFAADDVARIEAIRDRFPDAFIFPAEVGEKVEQDVRFSALGIEAGPQEKVPDERLFFTIPSVSEDAVFAFNEPGISKADVGPLSTEAITALALLNPFIRGGRALGGITQNVVRGGQAAQRGTVLPRLGEILGTGAAGAGASLTRDIAGGIEEGRAERAIQTGLAFAGFEAAAPLIGRMAAPAFQRIQGLANSNKLIVSAGRGEGRVAEFTPEGKRILEESNIPIDGISLEGKLNLNNLLKRGADQETFIRAAQSEALPVPVRQTTGQLTGRPKLLDLEQAAALGELTPREVRRVKALKEGAEEQLGANIERITEELGPGAPAMATVQERLIASRAARKAAVDEQFNLARAKGQETPSRIAPESIESLNQSFDDVIRTQGHIVEDMAKVKAILKKSQTASTIDDVFNLRQSLNKKTSDPSQNAAMRDLKGKLDDYIDNSLSDALMAGDDAAIGLYLKARKSSAEFNQIFNRKDFVQRFTTADASGRLAVEADEVANYLFGRSQLGAKAGLKGDLVKLKQVLRPDEWDAVRIAAWQRFFRNSPDAFPKNFGKEFKKAMRDSPEVMRTLFTPDELKLFGTLDTVAERVLKGESVPPEFIGKGRRIGNFMDSVPILWRISKSLSGFRAKRSLLGRGKIATPPSVAPGLTGVAGGLGFDGEPPAFFQNLGFADENRT